MTVQFYVAKEERFLLYGAELRMFRDSPLVGVGPGLFGENLKRYALKYYYTHHERLVERWLVGPDPHSSWFGWLARAGLVGIAGFVVLFASVLSRLLHRVREGSAGADIASVAATFLVGFLALGFIVEIMHLKLFWLFTALALAPTGGSEA